MTALRMLSVAWTVGLVIAMALVIAPGLSTGMQLNSSDPRSEVASLPGFAALAAPAGPRNLTLYLHNSTTGRNINGVNSPYLFDSLRTFGRNVTVSAVQQVRQDWYLYPLLAGNLTVNGSVTLHAYVSASGTTPQITPTLSIYERNSAGSEILVSSATFGSRLWWNTPHDLVLTPPNLLYTFHQGSSIHIILDIQAGTRTATIWWNATWVPSQVVLQSDDYARVENIAFLDSSGKARVSFDPSATNKDIRIFANITDPLGGYDLKWVNLSLSAPGGGSILSLVPMVPVTWTSNGYRSNFSYLWNYNGQPTGPYDAIVRVVDYTGFYAWSDTGSWAGNFVEGKATFFLGGLPYYVNLRAVDSRGYGLAGAPLITKSGGIALDTMTLDPQGRANISLLGGSYSLEVYWQDVRVAAYALTPTGNVSAQAPLVIATSVFYPTFTAQDSLAAALAGAAVIFQHPNGTQFGPLRTDAQGQVQLDQMAAGSYGVEVDWRGVQVFKGPVAVTGDGNNVIGCMVFQLTVNVVDSGNTPLVGAFVSLQDTSGLVFDANITDVGGSAVLRLPQGTYDVTAEYRSSYLGSGYGGKNTARVVLDASKAMSISVPVSQPSFAETVLFPVVLAYALTTVGLGALLFLLWRRGKGPAVAEAGQGGYHAEEHDGPASGTFKSPPRP